jgi:hypothetical protein
VELNITDPHFMANAHELYADMRAKGPVSRVRFAGMEQEVSGDGTEEQQTASSGVGRPSSSPTMMRLSKPCSTTALR